MTPIITSLLIASVMAATDDGFQKLFPHDGVPKGWSVRAWNNLAKLAGQNTEWRVTDGILQPGKTRGTWLVSDQTYTDFILEFEIKLTENGNSGVALRAPLYGDPAFDGLEFQVADLRYNPQAKESELTGGIYRAIAPKQQVYRPLEWNQVRLELQGSRLKANINSKWIQDIDLSQFTEKVQRHDGSMAPAVKDRPYSGHIGFQHLSRNNEPVLIRKVHLKELPKKNTVTSGVPVGKRPGPYSFLVATGPQRGQQTCFICEQENKPSAVVFARSLTPELASLLVELDDPKHVKNQPGYKAWMTLLNDQADLNQLAKWSQSHGLKSISVGIFEDRDGPPSYRLHSDAEITVLLFVHQRVMANYSFRAGELNNAAIREIRNTLPQILKSQ